MRGRRGAMRGGRDFLDHSLPVVEDKNPLDMLNYSIPSAQSADPRLRRHGESFHAYESEEKESNDKESVNNTANQPPDISNLLALAAKFGLLPSAEPSASEDNNDKEIVSAEPVVNDKVQEKPKDKPIIIPVLPTVDVLLVADKKYFEVRRQILIDQLCTGLQCATCGLRFPPDQNAR